MLAWSISSFQRLLRFWVGGTRMTNNPTNALVEQIQVIWLIHAKILHSKEARKERMTCIPALESLGSNFFQSKSRPQVPLLWDFGLWHVWFDWRQCKEAHLSSLWCYICRLFSRRWRRLRRQLVMVFVMSPSFLFFCWLTKDTPHDSIFSLSLFKGTLAQFSCWCG